ncbi:hypothetical protein [Parerythrobacter lacustris]|uniref:Autotransporter outer membrane beta-barrel domain-containing protein n=1 Tax=Parerythrobacter lacustris TaxID=2969984 RepID=A0ABT1XT23_9SPHN|nr:hypothetical protein [Parerythrobacter lacustris]MCR2834814.1 hypothetical protein [Parerythrobacter lacustris]
MQRSAEIAVAVGSQTSSEEGPSAALSDPLQAEQFFALKTMAETGTPAERGMLVSRHRSVEVLAGHQMMWMAAMSQFPVSSDVAALLRQTSFPAYIEDANAGFERPTVTRQNRWSLDGWMLYRPDSGTPGFTGGIPTSYGASQAGVVVNFSLAPTDRHLPRIYVRGTQALVGARETEAAFGLSARPVPSIPVRAMAEMRVQRVSGDNRLRPAIVAVSEMTPVKLPLGARGEVYAQAGYVGGDFATPFVDGQARITREVAKIELGQVDVGTGLWGGAQNGAARLDVGPTASIHTRVGEVPARLSVDYRERLAGDAAPGSGVAVTFSVGF